MRGFISSRFSKLVTNFLEFLLDLGWKIFYFILFYLNLFWFFEKRAHWFGRDLSNAYVVCLQTIYLLLMSSEHKGILSFHKRIIFFAKLLKLWLGNFQKSVWKNRNDIQHAYTYMSVFKMEGPKAGTYCYQIRQSSFLTKGIV